MKINYTLSENDFLTYQLFTASQSPLVKKTRRKTQLLFTLIYSLGGVYFLFQDNMFVGISFILLGIVSFFVHPILVRRKYVKHYQAFIKENYQGRVGRDFTLLVNDDCLTAIETGIETKVPTEELDQMNEIASCIFIKLKSGETIILPKDKIQNYELLISRLKELASHLHIEYKMDHKWKWT